MNNKVINGNKYIIVDTNKKYQWPIFPKNNQKYSYDRKFVSNDGNLSLSSWKVIFESNNEAEKFMWTSDNKYYIKFNFSFWKESSPIDIYVYSLEQNKWTYLGLIGTDGNSIKVKEIVWIFK